MTHMQYKCELLCHGKTFSTSSTFEVHMVTHTGEKTYQCNICGNSFSTNNKLKVQYALPVVTENKWSNKYYITFQNLASFH